MKKFISPIILVFCGNHNKLPQTAQICYLKSSVAQKSNMGLLCYNQGGKGYFLSAGSTGEFLSFHFPASRNNLCS